MKITGITTHQVEIPLKPARRMISALGQHTVSRYVLVRVETDGGIEGVGEATVMARWSGETAWGAQAIIDHVEKEQLRSDIPDISVGDTIDVHVRIVEGSKERVQVFAGVVLRITGTGMSRTFTVRRIVANEGVERIFPIHSPMIAKIEIKRHSHIRRSKLYYLRDRRGKSARIAEKTNYKPKADA